MDHQPGLSIGMNPPSGIGMVVLAKHYLRTTMNMKQTKNKDSLMGL